MPPPREILIGNSASVATTLSGIPAPAVSWQESMRRAIRSPQELCARLELPAELASSVAASDFAVFVPEEFLGKIEKRSPQDPLLRQVFPSPEEMNQTTDTARDAVGDGPATRSPGLIHKYAGRALMIATGACAVHCRYCFRRHFPYSENSIGGEALDHALAVLRHDSSVHEVLLSGGDPLTLPDARLQSLVGRLESIAHLRRLRIHTRLPIMIPGRVTDELLQLLTATRFAVWMVVHVNHPRELDRETSLALARLVNARIPVLNQAVLLRGVNDSVEVLVELCESLIDLRIQPYYLHQLDRVTGAAHFEVPIARGMEMMEQVRQRLPGYAVPRYVVERAGRPYKDLLY